MHAGRVSATQNKCVRRRLTRTETVPYQWSHIALWTPTRALIYTTYCSASYPHTWLVYSLSGNWRARPTLNSQVAQRPIGDKLSLRNCLGALDPRAYFDNPTSWWGSVSLIYSNLPEKLHLYSHSSAMERSHDSVKAYNMLLHWGSEHQALGDSQFNSLMIVIIQVFPFDNTSIVCLIMQWFAAIQLSWTGTGIFCQDLSSYSIIEMVKRA